MPRCTKVAIFDFTFHASQKLPFYEEHIRQALAKLHPHLYCKIALPYSFFVTDYQ